MASTGFNFAAIMEGKIPEIIPIITEIDIPINTLKKLIETSNSETALTKTVRIKISNIPAHPPIKQRKTDSNKNCKRIK